SRDPVGFAGRDEVAVVRLAAFDVFGAQEVGAGEFYQGPESRPRMEVTAKVAALPPVEVEPHATPLLCFPYAGMWLDSTLEPGSGSSWASTWMGTAVTSNASAGQCSLTSRAVA